MGDSRGGDTPGPPPFLLPTVLQCNLKILYTQALGRILAVLRSSGAGRGGGGWGSLLSHVSLSRNFLPEQINSASPERNASEYDFLPLITIRFTSQLLKNIYLFKKILGYTLRHVGSKFHDQGLNTCPLL